MKELPILHFASQTDWDGWLAANHRQPDGIWLKIAKKGRPVSSLSYLAAVETALCWGWIDGHKGALDEDYWIQKFTPRRRRSQWSKINRTKAEELIAAGLMQPSGLEAVQTAKANGQWEAAYDSPSTASVPADFLDELSKDPKAEAFFRTINATNRYAIIYRINSAKKPETRAARIKQFVDMMARGEKLY